MGESPRYPFNRRLGLGGPLNLRVPQNAAEDVLAFHEELFSMELVLGELFSMVLVLGELQRRCERFGQEISCT